MGIVIMMSSKLPNNDSEVNHVSNSWVSQPCHCHCHTVTTPDVRMTYALFLDPIANSDIPYRRRRTSKGTAGELSRCAAAAAAARP